MRKTATVHQDDGGDGLQEAACQVFAHGGGISLSGFLLTRPSNKANRNGSGLGFFARILAANPGFVALNDTPRQVQSENGDGGALLV